MPICPWPPAHPPQVQSAHRRPAGPRSARPGKPQPPPAPTAAGIPPWSPGPCANPAPRGRLPEPAHPSRFRIVRNGPSTRSANHGRQDSLDRICLPIARPVTRKKEGGTRAEHPPFFERQGSSVEFSILYPRSTPPPRLPQRDPTCPIAPRPRGPSPKARRSTARPCAP